MSHIFFNIWRESCVEILFTRFCWAGATGTATLNHLHMVHFACHATRLGTPDSQPLRISARTINKTEEEAVVASAPVHLDILGRLDGYEVSRGGLHHLLIDFEGQTMEATLLHLAVSHFHKNGGIVGPCWAQRWGHFLWETIPS